MVQTHARRGPRVRTVRLLLLSMLLALASIAACTREVVREVPTEVTREVVVEKAGDPGSLVVYSGRSESLVGPVIKQFGEVTGIKVSVKYGSTSAMAATLLEEGSRSPADVYFAQDPGGLAAVVQLLAPLPDPLLQKVPAWARSPEKKWVGISGRARVVTYNTAKLSEADLPDSLEGFTDPKWRGRIGWPPTNASFQTMVTAMRIQWGEERTRRWLEGIKANNPRTYADNTYAVAAVGAGEVDVAFVNHYYLYRFLQERGESFPARNYYPRSGGPESLVMVAGAGILATGKNRVNAEKFLDFLLSQVAQQFFANQTYEYPLVSGVNTLPIIKPMDQVKKPEIDMADLKDLVGTQTLMRQLGIIS
ncbi:MAG: iron ABC transporter substrate-binding protein [SAR202 cluster bacterium]|nr:iron ABC transporter substrate-binding protein [SAR202 cluster bacterium]